MVNYNTKMNQVNMLYNEFKEFFLDGFHTHKYDKYVEDGTITIDYTYLPYKNGKTYIKFNIPETDTGMTISYGGSSPFAMWWCQLTDGIEVCCKCCGDKVVKVNKLGIGACCEKCAICERFVEPDGNDHFICPYCQDDGDDAKTVCDE